MLKAGRILLFACLFLWTGVSAWAIANPENRCSRVATGAISNARYYDPELGRFIQPDDIIPDFSNPQSYNRYSYVLNNPLRYTDPSGHEAGYTYDATGMHSGLDSPEAAARMEWTANKVVLPAVNAAFWAMDKMDEGMYSMRSSPNPFTRAAGAGLWGASWVYGGGETRGVRETMKLAEAMEEAEKGITVLGHYSDDYIGLAKKLKANYFNIKPEVWAKMSEAEQWAANQKFLDEAIARGDDIILATPFQKAKKGSAFERELKYLQKKGYKPSADGKKMIRPHSKKKKQ